MTQPQTPDSGPGDTELGGPVPAAEDCSAVGWGPHRSVSPTPSPRLCDQKGWRPELVTCSTPLSHLDLQG